MRTQTAIRPMDLYTAVSIAEGFNSEPADEARIIEAWQYLHDTGQGYALQGWFGRTLRSMLAEGLIHP